MNIQTNFSPAPHFYGISGFFYILSGVSDFDQSGCTPHDRFS
jgi:hypothetical protein